MPIGQVIANGIGSPSTIGLFITSGFLSAVPVEVPDVVGLTQAQAETDITNAGLVPVVVTAFSSTVLEGDVISQSPIAGSEVAEGSEVQLTVSLGPQPTVEGYTVLISFGVPTVIAQTTAYALPARVGRLQSTAAMEISPDGVNGWVTLTGATTGAAVQGGFTRCTGSTAVVTVVGN